MFHSKLSPRFKSFLCSCIKILSKLEMSHSLMKGGLNPYYDNYGSETMTKLDDYTGNISALLSSLEEKNLNADEVHLIKLTTSSLLGMFEDNQSIAQSELEDILKSIKAGSLSVNQIKNMKSDNEKSEYALRTALKVQSLLDKQFESMAMLVEAVESGGQVNVEDINGMFKEMNVLMNSVNSITKVMTMEGDKVEAVIQETEAKLVSEIAQVTNLHETAVNHGVHVGHSKVNKFIAHAEHNESQKDNAQSPHGALSRITPRHIDAVEEEEGVIHKNNISKKLSAVPHKHTSSHKQHHSNPGISPSTSSAQQ